MNEDLNTTLISPKGTYNLNYIRANFPDHYKNIMRCPGESFSEKLYQYINGVVEHKCKVCGKPTRFKNIAKGYYDYCSYKCIRLSEECREKTKKTCLERYGVENVSQNEDIKQKKKDTCKEHFGVDSHMKLDGYRYNLVNVLTKTYGPEYHDEISKHLKDTTEEQIHKKYPEFVCYTEDRLWMIKCPHSDCCDKCNEKTFVTKQQMYHDRLRWGSETCTKLLGIGKYTKNTSLEIFVKNILDKYNIEYQTNVRTIIPPKELDIYIPSKKIAIECNGVYWHSSEVKSSSYHKKKYEACQENGIQLITLWEDWIINKPQIVESVLISKLGICNNIIYARKCTVHEITSPDASKFLNYNHIQGSCKSTIRYGLYYNNELVSVMCFSKRSKLSGSKYVKDNEWELIRFCNKLNYRIIGGASKLLAGFVKNHNPKIITSFSSNDISNGNLYQRLGFEKGNVNQSYWYIDRDFKRYHRSTFTKSNIIKKYPNMDCNLTESQMMSQLPYIKIYDSGTTNWRKEFFNIK